MLPIDWGGTSKTASLESFVKDPLGLSMWYCDEEEEPTESLTNSTPWFPCFPERQAPDNLWTFAAGRQKSIISPKNATTQLGIEDCSDLFFLNAYFALDYMQEAIVFRGVDDCTRYTILASVDHKDHDSLESALIRHWIAHFGPPRTKRKQFSKRTTPKP